MACEENVCGIKGSHSTLPPPGEPNNDSNIWASESFGGVDVYWKLPSSNAHAIAFTKLLRGTTNRLAEATEIVKASGSFFYDKNDTGKTERYYYWIQHISISGRETQTVGPASALSKPPIRSIVGDLNAEINESHLAKALKEEIAGIRLNRLGITEEMLERAKTDDGLAASIKELRAFSEKGNAILQQEVLLQAGINQSLGQAVNTLQVTFNKASAGVQTQIEALAKDTEATAKLITTTESKLGKDIARVETSTNTTIKKVNGVLTEVSAQYMAKVQANGLIGGFGLYNDSKRVDAGFDVDRFWIGRGGKKLRPFIIDGNNIFLNGRVEFNRVDGLGALAGRNEIGYGELGGPLAQTVRNNAATGAAGAARVNTWVRPGTTMINGNQIFTGDAYVDTLQIKGNAVIIPASVHAAGATGTPTDSEWKTVVQVTLPHLDAGVYAIQAGFSFNHSYSFSSVRSGLVSVQARVIDNWGEVHVRGILFDRGYGTDNSQQGSYRYAGGTFSIGGQLNKRFGGRILQLQIQRTHGHRYGGHTVANRFITVLGAQR